MYSWEKSRKHQKNPPLSSSTLPSFSSTLLDEIYHSIDAGGLTREQTIKIKEEEEPEALDSRRRVYRVEKWMENRDHLNKISTRRRQSLPDYDRAFFTSPWSSSDSSSGGETESPALYKQRSSCFTATAPIPVRTTISQTPKSSKHTSDKSFPLDSRNEDIEPKSKVRALKMYNSLKKAKQPISPGIRLTSFLNSLFSHGNGKKAKQPNEDASKPRQTSSSISTCSSSSSSYRRSCLTNKTSSSVNPPPKEKKPVKDYNGPKRTVRFDPVSVIVDEDDDGSDISSDLFELDHLAFRGSYNVRDYNAELPVYETTRVGRPIH